VASAAIHREGTAVRSFSVRCLSVCVFPANAAAKCSMSLLDILNR
jgi:hypothetical protein